MIAPTDLIAGQHVLPPPPTAWETFVNAIRPLFPYALLPILMIGLYYMFRKTWRELDTEAQKTRGEMLERGETDIRPYVALAICAAVLTIQEYHGGRTYYWEFVRPLLEKYDVAHPDRIKLAKYDELYGFAWWVGTRVLGYVIVPFPLWKLIFRKDSLRDFGLRTKGFFEHVWIYGLFLGCVLPAMFIVSRQPDFGGYYPFYKLSSRSWLDFGAWEAMYFVQFFALEMFFRGFWLGALRRSFGSGAIFAMAVPYCMIHYGKPYLEANGAIVAGIALGSLSMRTKSIYQGFLVHITVAGMMDWLALSHRDALPKVLYAPDTSHPEIIPPQFVVSGKTGELVVWLAMSTILMLVAVTKGVPKLLAFMRERRATPTAPKAESAE